jgi:hypothetical protein
MRRPLRILLIAVAVVVAAQFVPVSRDNPADHRGPGASPEVTAVLQRACFDCHSHDTIWPWYSHIAPISWGIARDVHEGRRKFNLSDFQDLSEETQVKVRAKALEQVEKGEMPPWYYLPMHPTARLSEQDKAVLKTWK